LIFFACSPARGCLGALTSSLLFLLTVGIVAAPVLAAAAIPLIARVPVGYVVAVPAALIYAIGVYIALLRGYSTNALIGREMHILEECLTGDPG